MKRIYLVGAALLLFIFLGVKYFSYKKHAPETESKVAAVSATDNSITAIPAAKAVDNSPAAPLVTEAPIVVAARTKTFTGNYPKKHRKISSRANHTHSPKQEEHGAIYTQSMPNVFSAPVASATEATTTVQASNEYFGNVPAENQVIITRRNNKPAGIHRNSRPRFAGFGPEVGYNQSGFSNNNTPDMQISSVYAGINTNLAIGDHIALQPGLRYINKGNRTGSTEDVNTKEKLTLHYLQMPLNLVYKIGDVSNARVIVGAGPYVSYLLGSKHKFSTASSSDGSFVDVVPQAPVYNTANVPKFDWGVGGFIGAEIPEGLYAKAGIETGLRDLQRNPDGTGSNRSYSVLFSVGYILGGFHK